MVQKINGEVNAMIESKEIGRVSQVRERSEVLGDGRILYRLVKLEADFSLYLLLVKDSSKEVAMIVGSEKEKAENLFEAFANGLVSPCTANDIFKDIILQ